MFGLRIFQWPFLHNITTFWLNTKMSLKHPSFVIHLLLLGKWGIFNAASSYACLVKALLLFKGFTLPLDPIPSDSKKEAATSLAALLRHVAFEDVGIFFVPWKNWWKSRWIVVIFLLLSRWMFFDMTRERCLKRLEPTCHRNPVSSCFF